MTSIYNKHIKYKNHMRTLRITFDPGDGFLEKTVRRYMTDNS